MVYIYVVILPMHFYEVIVWWWIALNYGNREEGGVISIRFGTFGSRVECYVRGGLSTTIMTTDSIHEFENLVKSNIDKNFSL